MCRSIILELQYWQKSNPDVIINTLYIGGGNPGILNCDELDFFLGQLFQFIDPDKIIEKSIETNPLSVSSQKIQTLNKYSFNRLSLGIQTLNNKSRKIINRKGQKKIILEKIDLVTNKFTGTLNLDFIYLLPGETSESFLSNIEEVLNFQPGHLSLYQLTLENQNVFFQKCQLAKKENDFLNPENIYKTEKAFKNTLQNHKYIQYEVSNWAKTNIDYCLHNYQYWQYRDFIGLGPGAVSMYKQKRWQNEQNIKDYCLALSQGKGPPRKIEILSEEIRQFEFFMMGLRLSKGIEIKSFFHQFSESPLHIKKVQKLIDEKKLIVDNDNIRVAENYKHLLNNVLMELL